MPKLSNWSKLTGLNGLIKLSASAAANEFSEWVQVGTELCLPHQKYLIKSHLSLSFSAACAASIVT